MTTEQQDKEEAIQLLNKIENVTSITFRGNLSIHVQNLCQLAIVQAKIRAVEEVKNNIVEKIDL